MDDKQSTLAVVGMVAIVAVVGVIALMQGSAQQAVAAPDANAAGQAYSPRSLYMVSAGGDQCNGASRDACSRYGNCEWCPGESDCVEAGSC